MLLRSRQIQAEGGEIIDVPNSWSWDSYQQSRPGYMLWVVFKGELTVQTASNTWLLRAGHVLSIPTDKELFKAENRSPSLSNIGWASYHDLTESPAFLREAGLYLICHYSRVCMAGWMLG